ncbi:MAG: S-methyl-5-thioribose-1-phosphate isomerase [Burkholderiales bacterium]|nr:S-methyl-5-thioribose-1-phosphate isomerase [Burkholderiales bacterium]
MAARSGGVETLRWTGHRLELIDQRALPQRLEYVACASAAETAAAIRDMVVRGAPAIGCAAAFGVALEAARLRDASDVARAEGMHQAFAALRASRPTAVNLFWALDRMQAVLASVAGRSGAEIAAAAAAEAQRISAEDIEINRAMGRHGAALVRDGARIMTHCNAGALATAGYGTALGVVRAARDAGKRISVIANETRPFLQGARLTAWELVQERIPVTLVTDGMAGHLMQTGKVDLVVVGADRVAANGDVANKIGTYTLAVLAARHRLPFYVAAPCSTIDLSIRGGDAIPIEERPPGEVTGFRGVRWAPDGVAVANPAFDVTPAELVTALITERGVVQPPTEAGLRALFG